MSSKDTNWQPIPCWNVRSDYSQKNMPFKESNNTSVSNSEFNRNPLRLLPKRWSVDAILNSGSHKGLISFNAICLYFLFFSVSKEKPEALNSYV